MTADCAMIHEVMLNYMLQRGSEMKNNCCRYYATGSFYHAIGDMHGPSKVTVCRVVRRVTGCLVQQLVGAIMWPDTEERRVQQCVGFQNVAGMPNIVGKLNHIEINHS